MVSDKEFYGGLVAKSDRPHYRGRKKTKKAKRKPRPKKPVAPKDLNAEPQPKKKYVITEEHRQKLRENMLKARAKRQEMVEAGTLRTKVRSDIKLSTLRERLGDCNIIEFTRDILRLSLEGYPFLELVLRCSEGLPLPEGKVKTYIEVPSDGFAVKEVEMTWPEYFTFCSRGVKTYVPGKRPQIILLRVGRRGTKSTAGTVKALYLGSRKVNRNYVRPSEVMVIPILATSEDQAEKIIKQRCHEVLKDADATWLIGALDPELHQSQVTNDTLPLVVGTEIVAFPCNSKRVRGEATPLVVFDEYPQFAFEGRKKDKDIRAAATGGQGQFPGAQFMAIGTPAAAQGDFWELEQAAADDPAILALHAASWTAAPLLYRNNPDYYHNNFKWDPHSFDREFRANYAASVEPMYREEDVVPALILAGEVPFDPRFCYGAGIDQSGLSGNDRFALCVCYYDPDRDVCGVAASRSWSVSDLDLIMSDSQCILHRYGIYEVMTDRYAQGYVSLALMKIGVQSVVAPNAVELHIAFRRMLVARKVELPVVGNLKQGLLRTQEFRTVKSNRPSISHPRDVNGHGDEVEALVRAARQAVQGNYMSGRTSLEQEMLEAEVAREEAAYDPLTIPL